jgi:hypothetical protein
MIYGNHDYETELVYGATEETDCKLIQFENEYNGKHNIQLALHQWKSLPVQKTLIIMIDTTMYDANPSEVGCYKHAIMDDKSPETLTLEMLKEKQMEWIQSIPEPGFDVETVILVGHHPILNYKWKEEKDKKDKKEKQKGGGSMYVQKTETILGTNTNNELGDVLKKVKTRFGNAKYYYYLCADLHQYQRGTITHPDLNMTIEQHIVGTGGATKDEFNPNGLDENEINQKNSKNGFTYTMSNDDIGVSGMKNGYLECSYGENGWDFQFVDVNKQKTKTRKTKTRKTKTRKTKTRKTKTRKTKTRKTRKTKSATRSKSTRRNKYKIHKSI